MRLAFVGEAPGYEEMEEGRPFVGPSGLVLWNFAARYANLQRSDVEIFNWSDVPLTKEMKKGLDPAWRAERDAELEKTLEEGGIDVAAALGGYAVEALLGEGYSLFWSNGVAITRPDGLVVVPVVHPGAGLHESTMLERTAQGLAGLRRFLDGGPSLPPNWRERSPGVTKAWEGEWEGGPVAIDTEGSKEKPLCLTASFDGETAYIIYAHEVGKLVSFARHLITTRQPIILHNAMWDASVLRAMGIEVWDNPVVDTMVLAYNLQNIPRGLKELTRGQLGFPMRDYDEVVRPYAEAEMKRWRQKAFEQAANGLEFVQQFTARRKPRKSGGAPVYKIEGPEVNLDIYRHISRDQQLSLREQEWAKIHVGPMPGMDLRLVPANEREEYAGRDALVTRRLFPILLDRVKADGLTDVSKLDMEALPLIEDMQRTGMHVDLDRYWEVAGAVSQRKEEVKLLAQQVVGRPDFNPGSPDQLRDYALERGLQLGRPTPTGRPSTEDNVLEMFKESDPLFPLILEYRELDKYDGTYLLPLGQLIRPTADGWRLFAELRATTVVSGRLSAHNPNVLAWPARTPLGLRLRSIFTAPPGKVLASWDLSQIELRLTAAFSGDPVMTEAFTSGRDLHTTLASKLFGVPYEKVDKYTQRYPAKTIHYGLLYGEGGATLYEELRGAGITAFSRDDCYRLLEETWDVYRVAGEYLRSAAADAKRRGYVTDFLGRRRYLPGAHLVEEANRWDTQQIRGLRLESERQAGNFVIQAAASEILKRAMVRVYRDVYPATRGTGLRLWLQIHDELMGEVDEGAFEQVNVLIKEAMTADSPLLAPIMIETEGVAGPSWGELKG